jgi:hypothetical protein
MLSLQSTSVGPPLELFA